jgi:hypothetical protein
MNIEPERDFVSVNILGNFNPAIYHPAWFKHHNLIGSDDYDYAMDKTKNKFEVVHQSLCSFAINDGLNILSTIDKFQISGGTYLNPKIRDLIIGTFNILGETPINAFGINRIMDFKMDNHDQFIDIIQKIAPLEKFEGIMSSPSLKELEISSKSDDDRIINIRILPTKKFEYGIFIEVNNHYDKDNQDKLEIPEMLNMFEGSWSDLMESSLSIAKAIIEVS